MDHVAQDGISRTRRATAFYFDGPSSRRRTVRLVFGDALEISEDGAAPVACGPMTISASVDSPAGVLRVAACPRRRWRGSKSAMRRSRPSSRRAARSSTRTAWTARAVAKIVGWSLAALASIVMVVLFAVPLAADRLAPLVPQSFERRIGEVADKQIRASSAARSATARQAGGLSSSWSARCAKPPASILDRAVVGVVDTEVPNAFALPGGKVYLFDGLLAKARKSRRDRRRARARTRPSQAPR